MPTDAYPALVNSDVKFGKCKIVMGLTSLLGENAAQKFNNGLTVANVWLLEISRARRVESSMNLSWSCSVSISHKDNG